MEEKFNKETQLIYVSCSNNPITQKPEICISFEQLILLDFSKNLSMYHKEEHKILYSFKVLSFKYIFIKDQNICYEDLRFKPIKIKPEEDHIISSESKLYELLIFLQFWVNKDIRLKDKEIFNKVRFVVLEIELIC